MGGSYHYDKNARRFFVQVFWESKRIRIWKYNGEPLWAEQIARKLLDKIRAEIDSKEFNPKAYFPKYPLSISEYCKQWLKVIDVSPNTLKDYRYSVRKFIIPFFNDKDIRKIRHNDLCEFYKWIPRTAKGKYNVLSCLRTMLRHAWRNEDISRVPPFPTLSYDPPEIIEYLTMDQQEKILQTIPERHRAIFMIMMEYGLRPGEARALKWDCVTDNELFIRRSFSENLLRETTKTKRIRQYGLTPYVKDILKNKVRSIDGFLFIRDDGKPYTNKDLNKIWRTACGKVGIKIKLYNAVRHSLGCQLLDEGRELELVRDILGHTRSEMTRRYAKRSSEVIKNVLTDRRKIIPMVGKRSVKKK